MADKYIAMLQILETKKVQDLDVPSRIAIQLQLTDPDLKSRDRVVKKSEIPLPLRRTWWPFYRCIAPLAPWVWRAMKLKRKLCKA